MYSHEIQKLLELRNNIVSYKEYIEIVKSPQVDHIKYEDEQFKVWTNDGYTFSLKIKKNHNK
jgi:hypothetical protein